MTIILNISIPFEKWYFYRLNVPSILMYTFENILCQIKTNLKLSVFQFKWTHFFFSISLFLTLNMFIKCQNVTTSHQCQDLTTLSFPFLLPFLLLSSIFSKPTPMSLCLFVSLLDSFFLSSLILSKFGLDFSVCLMEFE